MTVTSVAVEALIAVAQTYIQSLSADPTFGVLYTTVRFQRSWLLDTYDGPAMAIYEIGGQSDAKGLGTIKQWRHPQLRVDVMAADYPSARTLIEQARIAWENDFNFVNGNGAVGQDYLRSTGGIKNLTFTEMRSAPLEKRGYFRRFIDIVMETGD